MESVLSVLRETDPFTMRSRGGVSFHPLLEQRQTKSHYHLERVHVKHEAEAGHPAAGAAPPEKDRT